MMNNRWLVNTSVRLLVAWLALSVVGIVFAKQLLTPFLPFFATIIDRISADFSSVVNISHYKNSDHIVLIANVVQPIRLVGNTFFSPGSALTAGSDVVHSVVPMVILYTVLFSWPVNQFRERAISLLLGFPMLYVVLGLTTPQLLAGRIAIQVYEHTVKAGGVPQEPFVIKWMIFAESGGSWLLALAGALVCIMLTKRLSSWLVAFANTTSVETESCKRKTKKEKKQAKKSKVTSHYSQNSSRKNVTSTLP